MNRDHVALSLITALACVTLGCSTDTRSGSADDSDTLAHGTPNERRFAPLDLPPPTSVRLITGAPGPGYWQQRCDHDIAVRLDVDTDTIDAHQRMTYTNNSPDELRVVWIQLEQNHFRRNSDGAILGGPSDRFGNRTRFDGGINTLEITLPDGTSLDVDVVGTVGRIDLPAPIAPRGGRIDLDMRWSFAIPPYGDDRMGIEHAADGDIYEIAQWFPTACVYDDVVGWNTRQFLGLGEFYTNFGDYTVSITVPADHLVAATGTLTNEHDVLTPDELARFSQAHAANEPVVIIGKDEIGTHASPITDNGTATWRFHADNVRSFVWASSRAFMWDACTIPAGSAAAHTDVLVQSFYPKEAITTWAPDAEDQPDTQAGSTRMLRDSILAYGTRWYAYPYPAATNVSGLVSGMEYPMVCFCGGREDPHALWGVTTHEIGHTWFPMVVNSNERLHAWMDEGLNSFMNHYATIDRYGKEEDPHAGARNERAARRLARVRGAISPHRLSQCVDTPPDMLAPGTLGVSQYARPSIALRFLRERVLGPETFDRAFRAYIERWAFKSPTPADFFRTMESESGVDLDWFFRAWFYSTDTPDIAVTSVNQPEGAARTARVSFRNVGGMVMPVYYRVTYSNGTTEDRHIPVIAWAAGDTAADWWDTAGRNIRRVEIDPDGETPDYNERNNVWGR